MKRTQRFNKPMIAGLYFMIGGSLSPWLFGRVLHLPADATDAVMGLFYGLMFGCMFLGLYRQRRGTPPDGRCA